MATNAGVPDFSRNTADGNQRQQRDVTFDILEV